MEKQVCKSCGSSEVARCKWVNVNDDTIYNADSGTDLEWCMDCKDETRIIGEEDFKKEFLERDLNNTSDPSCEECGDNNIEWSHYNRENNEHYMKCNKCKHVFEASLR